MTQHRVLLGALTVAVFAVRATCASAQCEIEKVTENVSAGAHGFAAALDADRGLALVGVPYDDTACPPLADCNAGAVVAYELTTSGWTAAQTILPPDQSSDDGFGDRIYMSGSLALIERRTPGNGPAHRWFVYEHLQGSWTYLHAIYVPAGTWGRAVGVGEDVILIGQPTNSGSVWIYEEVAGVWTFQTNLQLDAALISGGNNFGSSIDIDGDTAIIGMPGYSPINRGTAVAFVRDATGWSQSGPRFVTADSEADDRLGDVVAIGGDTAVVWAPGKSAAYVFEPSPGGWVEAARLETTDGVELEPNFEISGDRVFVGVPSDPVVPGGTFVGSVYVFERGAGDWLQVDKWWAGDANAAQRFGSSLGLSGGSLLVAAPGDTGNLGAFYAFATDGPRNFCTSSANSSGNAAVISTSGGTSVSVADLELVATGLPLNQPGIFYYGPGETTSVLGNGTRCVGDNGPGTVFRLPIVQSGPAGTFTHALDFGAAPAMPGHPGELAAGYTWKFQAWFRDPAGGGLGFDLSDGLSVTFCP